MTKSRANALLQSRIGTRHSRAHEARLLGNAEYIEIRARYSELSSIERSARTDAEQDELRGLLARKYEIMEEVAA